MQAIVKYRRKKCTHTHIFTPSSVILQRSLVPNTVVVQMNVGAVDSVIRLVRCSFNCRKKNIFDDKVLDLEYILIFI